MYILNIPFSFSLKGNYPLLTLASIVFRILISFDGFDVTILRADSRKVYTILIDINLPETKL